jgi:hypothetical protein
MRYLLIAWFSLGTISCMAQAPQYKDLADRLKQILELDQKYRNTSDWRMMHIQDSLNLIEVVKILDTHGWLGPEEVGKDGSSSIFLVIQHAELPTQEKYFPMMKEAVKNKKARPQDLALLEDRILMRQGKKQIYGSQITSGPDGIMKVHPIDDPANVDKRRADIGLPPMAKYLEHFDMVWNLEEHIRQQEKNGN